MNNRYLMNENGDKYAGEDGLWTLDELETAVLDASGSLADSLRDQVVERCTGVSTTVDPLSGRLWTLRSPVRFFRSGMAETASTLSARFCGVK